MLVIILWTEGIRSISCRRLYKNYYQRNILMIVRAHNVDFKYPFILHDPLNRIYIFEYFENLKIYISNIYPLQLKLIYLHYFVEYSRSIRDSRSKPNQKKKKKHICSSNSFLKIIKYRRISDKSKRASIIPSISLPQKSLAHVSSPTTLLPPS